MKNNELNPELNDMLSRGLLSSSKVEQLVWLKTFVDRLATTLYVEPEEVKRLTEKYGVSPDILTWGDYFQTEIASSHFELSDDDFNRIIETVRFDLISSIMIFQDKPEEFLNSARYPMDQGVYENESLDEEQEEALHLSILARYYVELGLSGSELREEDEIWFQTFVAESNQSAG